MKKILLLTTLIIFSTALILKTSAMPNPWIDCGDDISFCAAKAGFNFPLRVENYSARAMKGMFEIRFPLKKLFSKNQITIRKVTSCKNEQKGGFCDTSGVYNDYPIDKEVKIKNGVSFKVKGKNSKFYVALFGAETGYYSIYSENGFSKRDLEYFYKILEEAEAPRFNFTEIESYSIDKLMDLRRVDDIVEPVYTQDCFPMTLKKKGVSETCFERANLGEDSCCSASEVKMIKEYYKKGQQNDPLNDGSGNFCAN